MEYPDDMSDSEAASTKADLEALKALQADASELEGIEELLDRYNVFEAIGFTKQEIMHSRFLAFLLDPKRHHGLDDLFLRGLLRKCSESTDGYTLPRVDHHDGGLGQTTVHTEVHAGDGRIDILLLNEAGKWAMIVENKVWTTEHSGQLEKYYQFVKENYPNHLVRGIYLTPHGDRPSHEEYLPLSYGSVCEILDGIVEDRGSSIPSDVRMSVEHYTGMVRRNIVTDPEISRLCREIFRKHYRALYVVIDNVVTAQDTIHKLVKGLIEETPRLAYGYREKGELEDYVVFDHEEWGVPTLRVGKRYHGSDRLLYFVVYSKFMESLEIWLELGPGNPNTRRRLFSMARRNPTVFEDVPDSLSEWTQLLKYPLLAPEVLQTLSDEEREREIRKRWAEFLDKNLSSVETALRKETWIWEPT
jgi:hypothetical protein